MQKIDVSIIIVSYNTKDLLDTCLASIYEQTSRVHIEVIVVDNNSTDGSVRMIHEKYKGVHAIENKVNVGFGKGNNQGIIQAKGETILLLNTDIVVLDRAIEKLYAFYKSLPKKSVVGGKLFNTDKTPQPSCGPKYSLKNIFIALFLKGDYREITRYSPERIQEVDWIMGACIMAEKQLFSELGGFDEGIFMYMEEIDLLHQAKKRGYKIYFFPDARFIHVGAASSSRTASVLNVYAGLVYFYKKHYSASEILVLRILLVLKAAGAIALALVMNNQVIQKRYTQALKVAFS